MADMTLEEALAAATVDEELVTPVNEVLLINPETRTINVPDSEKLFGARQDMDVERKYFKCPRIVGDNIDLFEHRIFVNYVPSKQDGSYDTKEDVQSYWCNDLAVEGDFVTFSWELSGNAMRSAGYIAFAVYAKTIDEYGNLKTKWHTTIAIGNVLDTLPDGEEWVTVYPDIVMQLLERMDEVEKIATEEAMQGYVDDYFNRNPMMIDRELKDETKAAPADIVGKLSEDIATKASAIKEKASGETIVVTDSDEAKPLGLTIDGKSEQKQYSGKNLLKNTAVDKTINGISVKVNEEKRFSVNGTSTNLSAYEVGEFTVKAGETYILTGCPSGGSESSYRLDVRKDSILGLYDNNIIDYGSGCSFTATEDITLKVFMRYNVNYTFNNIVFEPMVRLATVTDGTYEPYVGGKPSPSPEYKQEIRNIGVYDEASGKYAVEVKCTGKNRFNCEKWKSAIDKHASGPVVRGTAVFENNGITITANEANAYSGFEGASSYAYKIPVNIGDSIILSWEENSGKDGMVWIFANGDSAIGVNVNTKNTKEITYTVPEDTTFITVRFGVVNSGDTISYKNIMLRPVGTDDTYEPYKETTATVYLDEPLRKGDKAYWNGGSKVRVDRKRRRMLVDVSLMNKSSSTLADRFVLPKGSFGKYTPIENTEGLCNNFIWKVDNSSRIGYCWIDPNQNFICDYSIYGTTTLEQFRSVFSEESFEIEYEIATPITEEIDIDLGELSMFYPTTILSNDCNANMEVTYIADTKAYIDKKFAEIATAML